MNVYFRYTTTPLDALTFDSAAANQMGFVTLSNLPPRFSHAKIQSTTLSGRVYSRPQYSRRWHEYVISADELDAAAVAFFEAFWAAPCQYVSRSGAAYVRVATEGGDLPIEYLDGREDSPEATIKLTEVQTL